MTATTQQKSSQLKMVGQIAPHVEIVDVRLVRTIGRIWKDWSPKGHPKINLAITHKSRCRQEKSTLLAEVTFKLVGSVADDPTKKVVSLSADFELGYNLSREVDLTPRQLSAFANLNVLYNAWPYWREFVQNMAGGWVCHAWLFRSLELRDLFPWDPLIPNVANLSSSCRLLPAM
jgi:hypothetical protein